MKAVTPPRAPSAGSVTAKMEKMSAKPPLVIQILDPFRIQWSPSRTARVRMRAASEPAWGSVRPKAAIFSPRASGFRYLVLLRRRAVQVDGHGADADVGADGGHGAGAALAQLLGQDGVADLARAGPAVLPRERHAEEPHLGGLLQHVVGHLPLFSSISAARGATSRSTKSRMVRRSSWCSLLSVKSICYLRPRGLAAVAPGSRPAARLSGPTARSSPPPP